MPHSSTDPSIDLSIVVPLYRCAQTVEELTRRIHAALADRALRYEILLVDDASPDGTRTAAERAVAEDPVHTRLLAGEVRRGQQRAVLAGLRQARGRLWAAMDGDLQDPPELLPEMVSELENTGARVAFAARRGGHGSSLRALTSGVFKTLMAMVAGTPRDAGMYVVARREFLEPRLPTGDQWLWFPALLGAIGAGGGVIRVPFDRPRPTEDRPSAYSEVARLRLGVRALGYAIGQRVRAEESLRAGLEGLVVGVASALAGRWVLGRQPFDPGDEGFLYLVARAWAHGSNLYDHFDLLYPPGVHVMSGWPLATFGVDLTVYRGSIAVIFGVAAGLMVAALRRRGVSRGAVGCAIAALVGYGAISFKALPVALVLAAAFAALSKERPTARTLMALGLATGFLAGLREDATVLVAVCAGIAWLRRERRVRGAILLAASALASFGAWVALFAVRAGGREFLAHVLHRFEFLVRRVGEPTAISWSWTLPAGAPLEVWSSVTVPYQTMVLLALDLIVLGILWRRRRELVNDPAVRTAAIALAVSILFLPQFLWERRDTAHLRMHLAAFLPAMAASAALLPRALRRTLAITALALAIYPLALLDRVPSDPSFYPTPGAQAQRLWLRAQPPWAGRLRESGGTLIVLWWGPGWYALEDMPMGTQVLSTFARHHDPASVARLVGDLERPTNRWVLMVPGGETPTPVLEALSASYEKRDSWGGWELWTRRLSASASDPRSSSR